MMAKRVYFAFHYQDVADFRANVVRKHNALQGVEAAGYYDYSIWEESKKKGDLALKRMINSQLEGTSVTAVLVGALTYERRWVRYEIVKSVERGNRVLGIHINGVAGKNGLTKSSGPNPLDYLSLTIDADGLVGQPNEWDGYRWIHYRDLGAFTLREQPLAMRGKSYSLSHWFKTYDWVADDGYNNFGRWIS